MKKTVLACSAMIALGACGSDDGDSGPRALTTPEVYQDFFWSYCLPFAEILTGLASQANTSQALAGTVECPEGGTATYDDETFVATLTDCAGVGAVANGTLVLSLLEAGEAGVSPGQASISAGSLSIDGAYSGAATIMSGTMSWELPVADPTTYWELRLDIGGVEECIWSGAEGGPCPSPF